MSSGVLITGANGFLGSVLAAECARRGLDVHVLVRERADLSKLEGVRCTRHVGDLGDRASLGRALAAAAKACPRPWVVHSAAKISYRTRDRDLQRAVNVEGTRNLLAAAPSAGVGRVLHVSSCVTIGHAASVERPLDEDATFNGSELGVDYVDTKREAEELALAAARGIDLVVVNPGAIVGPGSSGANTLRFLRLAATGGLGPWTPPGSIAPVSVEDTARGCLLALERGARGRRYLLAESAQPLSRCFQLAARIFGRPPPRGPAPAWLWRSSRALIGACDRVRALDLITPQSLTMLSKHFVYDAKRARAELGWSAEPFESVLARTIAWAAERDLVPRPRAPR